MKINKTFKNESRRVSYFSSCRHDFLKIRKKSNLGEKRVCLAYTPLCKADTWSNQSHLSYKSRAERSKYMHGHCSASFLYSSAVQCQTHGRMLFTLSLGLPTSPKAIKTTHHTHAHNLMETSFTDNLPHIRPHINLVETSFTDSLFLGDFVLYQVAN